MTSIFLVPALNACRDRVDGTLACLRDMVSGLATRSPAPLERLPATEIVTDLPSPEDRPERPREHVGEVSDDATAIDKPVVPDGPPAEPMGNPSPAAEQSPPSREPAPGQEEPDAEAVEMAGAPRVEPGEPAVEVEPSEATTPGGATDDRGLVPVGERAAREVAAAVADAYEALAARNEPADPAAEQMPPVTVDDHVLPTGERAAREVAAALSAERDRAQSVLEPQPGEPAPEIADVEIPEAEPSVGPAVLPVGERAAREVAAAVAAEHDETRSVPQPEPVKPAAEIAEVETPEAEPSVSDGLLPVGERAAREVAVALADIYVVAPSVPEADWAPAGPEQYDDAAHGAAGETLSDGLLPVGERAAREVAIALAALHDAATQVPQSQQPEPSEPVAEIGESQAPEPAAADGVLPAGERAAREVAAALATVRDAAPSVVEPQQPNHEEPVAEIEDPVADVETRETRLFAADGLIPPAERAAREVAAAVAALLERNPPLPRPRQAELVERATAPEEPDADVAVQAPERLVDDDLVPVGERAAREVAAALAALDDAAPPAPQVAEPEPTEPASALEVPPRAAIDVAAVARGWQEAMQAAEHAESAVAEAADRSARLPPGQTEVPPPVEVAILPFLPASRPEEEPEQPSWSAEPAPSREAALSAPEPQPADDARVARDDDGPAPTILAVAISDAELARSRPGKLVVRRGDTLWDIAKRIYGDGRKYQTIYRANRDVIPRPGKLKPGQVLEIPLVYD